MKKTSILQEELDNTTPHVPCCMFDFLNVLFDKESIRKHGANNWLFANGSTCNKKSNYKSIFSHAALAYGGVKLDESGHDHRLHAACRLLMDYARDKLGLVHEEDKT